MVEAAWEAVVGLSDLVVVLWQKKAKCHSGAHLWLACETGDVTARHSALQVLSCVVEFWCSALKKKINELKKRRTEVTDLGNVIYGRR